MKLALLACLATASTINVAFAEPVEIVLGSGGKGGTYFPVINEVANFCNSETLLVSNYMDPTRADDPTAGGSVENLKRITNNLAMGGLVQADVAALELLGRNPAMARVLALLPLHTEHLHFIVPSVVTVELEAADPGGFLGFGAKEAVYGQDNNPIDSIDDLTGRTVVAWGGSVVSAQVVDTLLGLGLTVVPVDNQAAGLAAIDNGEADAMLAVAGAPVEWISKLPKSQYSLLTFNDRTAENLAEVYGTQPVSYTNLGTNGQRTDALTVNALLMTRTYRTPEMIGALSELQACVRENIFTIQDTPGTHPAWQMIDPNAEMLWDNIFTPPAEFTYPVSKSVISAPVSIVEEVKE